MDLQIRRPQETDFRAIKQLLYMTIEKAFQEEGIFNDQFVQDEVNGLLAYLKKDFQSGGLDEYFLVGFVANQMVGIIAHGKPNPIIETHLKYDVANTREIKSVYILPAFQRNGIGSLLFQRIIEILQYNQVAYYCLDCGFKQSQVYWQQQLGTPQLILKNYWGVGAHHHIWYLELSPIL